MPLTDDVVVRRKVSVREEATRRRRNEILDAAVSLFAAKGYNATSLRDVAGKAGMSHTGLLHHFPDKIGLLEAALDRLFDETAEEFGFESPDGITVLRALVGAAERDVKNPQTLRFLAVTTAEALSADHPAHGFMRRTHALVRRRLTEAIEDLAAQGRYRSDIPPAMAATHIAAARDGVITEWLLAPEQVDLVDTVKGHIRLFVDIDI